MRHAAPFTLFKRRVARKVFYYFQVRLENGKRTTARSTGKTTKAEAERYVLDLYRTGALTARSTMTFGTYAAS